MKKFAIFLAVVAVSAASFAQSPVGAWKGKVKIDRATLPKVTDPEQKKQMETGLKQVESMVFKLNLKANKTFTIEVPALGPAPAQKGEGTWSQKGNKVTLVTTKQNGQPPTNSKPQTMTIDAGGKKMILTPEGPQKITITFTK